MWYIIMGSVIVAEALVLVAFAMLAVKKVSHLEDVIFNQRLTIENRDKTIARYKTKVSVMQAWGGADNA